MSKQGYWRLFRFLNAAHVLTYVGIEAGYDEHNLFDPFNEKYVLLTSKEVVSIKNIGFTGEGAFQQVLTWSIASVKNEYDSGLITERQMIVLLNQCLKLRKLLEKFFDYRDRPVPFSYVQVNSLVVFVILPLFSYSIAYSYQRDDSLGVPLSNMIIFRDSIIAFCIVLIHSMTLLSLRTLAKNIQDPFGHNLEDISVSNTLHVTVAGSSKVLCAQPVGPKYLNPTSSFFVGNYQSDINLTASLNSTEKVAPKQKLSETGRSSFHRREATTARHRETLTGNSSIALGKEIEVV